MRILYFHQYFSTLSGSSGTRSYEMAKHLISQGHQVTMVYAPADRGFSLAGGTGNKGDKRGSFEGIELIEFALPYSNRMRLVNRAWVFLKYSIKSIKLIFTEQYDLVLATSTPLTAGIPGIVMKIFGKGKPFIFEVRDLWPELPKAMGVITNPVLLGMMSFLEYLSYHYADALIALSPGIKAGIERRLKHPKTVALIPNGCDLDLFFPGECDKSIIRGVTNKDFVATFTGAHGYANGLEAILDVAEYLKDTPYFDTIKLVLIGDGIKKESLLQRAAELNLTNVIFLDPVPKFLLVKFLNATDVGLMVLANIPAFYYGTSPNKFFDYISAGIPVLNNYPGWIQELIQAHDCGIGVKPGDAQAFAEALIMLYHSSEKLAQMSFNSRKLAEQLFDRKLLATKLEVLCKKISDDKKNL
jgi:glycosyltransferase involved in cell wall biosynthesis